MRKFLQRKPAGDAETLAVTSSSPPSSANATKAPVANLGGTDSALPPLAEVAPTTEVNWAPPDVDAEKLDLDPSASCRLGEVMQSARQRVEELVRNVDRYTATENIEHFELSPMGLKTSRETRKYNYLVEIRQVGKSDLDVQEYRNGWVRSEKIRGHPAREEFPANIATVGLPMLATQAGRLARSRAPRMQSRIFRQRTDQTSSMLTYHADNQFIAVGLKGRAWIDTESSQVVAMESDMLRPVPEIQLLRDHQLIEYRPVRFRNKSLELWLPKTADWYCSLNGHHFHRRHIFSGFLLFSLDDKQEISAPVEPTAPNSPK